MRIGRCRRGGGDGGAREGCELGGTPYSIAPDPDLDGATRGWEWTAPTHHEGPPVRLAFHADSTSVDEFGCGFESGVRHFALMVEDGQVGRMWWHEQPAYP